MNKFYVADNKKFQTLINSINIQTLLKVNNKKNFQIKTNSLFNQTFHSDVCLSK